MGWILFGKIPSEGDFVRHELRGALALECWQWLSEGVTALGAGAKLTGAARFALTSPHERDAALIGVMIASRDRVGRSFPLVAACPVSIPNLPRRAPALPIATGGALAAARRVLETGSAESFSSIVRRLAGLAPIPVPAITAAHERAEQALARMPSSEFEERVFSGPNADPSYAYFTVRAACAQAGKPSAPALVCPISAGGDAVAWLELVRRMSTSGGACSWLWPETERASEIGICLGSPPPALLALLSDRQPESARIWPLTTTSEPARERARKAFEALRPRASVPVASLFEALTQRGP